MENQTENQVVYSTEMPVGTTNIVTTFGYLIGIKKKILEQCYSKNLELLEKLEADEAAKTIRALSKLRTNFLYNFAKTDAEIKQNLINIDKMEWFDQEDIRWLAEHGIKIVKANCDAQKYTLAINKHINENIGRCKHLFPEWVNFDYIKGMIAISGYTKKNLLKTEFDKFMEYREFYPYQRYIYWKPQDCGNMLISDKKFLTVVYKQNNDVFADNSKCKDATEDTKEQIYGFIDNAEKVEIVVDCENSDVYKLCGMLTSLDAEKLKKIEKIILIDDKNTNYGWNILERATNIKVEYNLADRVVEQKSLVDLQMTAAICREHYKENVSSFILLSSDSDFWGVISFLRTADFFVIYEYNKIGENTRQVLAKNNIPSCPLDNFTTANTENFKRQVLLDVLSQHLADIDIHRTNFQRLVSDIYEETRIPATEKEKRKFFNEYVRTLKLSISEDGTANLELAG